MWVTAFVVCTKEGKGTFEWQESSKQGSLSLASFHRSVFPSAQLYGGQDELSSLCRIYFAV